MKVTLVDLPEYEMPKMMHCELSSKSARLWRCTKPDLQIQKSQDISVLIGAM